MHSLWVLIVDDVACFVECLLGSTKLGGNLKSKQKALPPLAAIVTRARIVPVRWPAANSITASTHNDNLASILLMLMTAIYYQKMKTVSHQKMKTVSFPAKLSKAVRSLNSYPGISVLAGTLFLS